MHYSRRASQELCSSHPLADAARHVALDRQPDETLDGIYVLGYDGCVREECRSVSGAIESETLEEGGEETWVEGGQATENKGSISCHGGSWMTCGGTR